jgi:hypothetical protein
MRRISRVRRPLRLRAIPLCFPRFVGESYRISGGRAPLSRRPRAPFLLSPRRVRPAQRDHIRCQPRLLLLRIEENATLLHPRAGVQVRTRGGTRSAFWPERDLRGLNFPICGGVPDITETQRVLKDEPPGSGVRLRILVIYPDAKFPRSNPIKADPTLIRLAHEEKTIRRVRWW